MIVPNRLIYPLFFSHLLKPVDIPSCSLFQYHISVYFVSSGLVHSLRFYLAAVLRYIKLTSGARTMMTPDLPDWKVRFRWRLSGTTRHRQVSYNNRHWDQVNGRWKDNEAERKKENELWKAVCLWVYGCLTVYGVMFCTSGGPNPEAIQEVLQLAKCCPQLTDFIRRRLEASHPHHLRHTSCLWNILARAQNKYERLCARAIKSGASLDMRSREGWERELLKNQRVSVFVVIPETIPPGQNCVST